MTALFYGCYSLSSMKIDNFNTENVQYMGDMFCVASSQWDLRYRQCLISLRDRFAS